MSRKPRLLFLFPEGWDNIALDDAAGLRAEFDVVTAGFDVFRFPENARLLWFDARRFVDGLARQHRGGGIVGVVSTNEQYGALAAAAVARRLGLPGTDPRAIVQAQHKYHAREALARDLPECTPEFALLPYRFGSTDVATRPPGLPFPFFVKPIKAAYSVLARRVDTPADLQQHLTFQPWETHIIKRLVRPFADLAAEHGNLAVDPLGMMGEALIDGVQINVDGWVAAGECHLLGVVDAVMYAGTSAFQRFEYPSRLPAAAQEGAFAVARRAIEAVGFDHGLWNVELFWNPADGSFKIIEINPRFAAQFGDLYEKVDGASPYQLLADLAVGRTPRWTRRAGRYQVAASFVFREFNGAVKTQPETAQLRWLAEQHPDARMQTFIKHGNSRWRETKWLGSYRYAIVNLGGADRDDLFARFADVCRNVTFERGGPVHVGGSVDAIRPGR